MRDWDQANVQGIARSESIGGAASGSAPARPRAGGRDPSGGSESTAIGVIWRKNAAKPGSSCTRTRYAARAVAESSLIISPPASTGGAGGASSGRGIVLGCRRDQDGAGQLLEVTLRDRGIAVIREDDLALLGELEPPIQRSGRA